MPIDAAHLRQHYASLSDEALLGIDTADLVAAAGAIYAEELERRNLRGVAPFTATDENHGGLDLEDPDWIDDAAEVYSHYIRPGLPVSREVEDAHSALTAAGIPSHMDLVEEEEKRSAEPQLSQRWRLLVPGKLNQYATSVIDRDIFNADFEAEWRSHLEMLSDEDLRTMHPQMAFCGLFDRIERVTRAYREELSHRGMNPETSAGAR